jgi:RND family efflux transporter MFP subunit
MVVILFGCSRPADRTEPPPPPAPLAREPLADLDAYPAATTERPPVREAPRRYVAVIDARDSVDVTPKVNGELVGVPARVGDRVQAGDVIAVLDQRPAREQLAMAQAELRSARASQVQAEVDVRDTTRKLAVEEELVRQGHRPAKAVEDARFRYEKARAALVSAEAAVSEREARLRQLERELEETTIRASFAGTIALRYRNAGALVGPGVPIVRLISGDALSVKFAVQPGDVGRVHEGDSVAVEIDTVARSLSATIREIAPALDPASEHVFVEADLVVPDDLRSQVRSGLDAWVVAAAAEPAATAEASPPSGPQSPGRPEPRRAPR